MSGFKFDGHALTTTPTTVSTDSSGNFAAPVTFTVPAATAGSHTVTGTDAAAQTGHQTLIIFAPKIAVSPRNTRSGT